MTLKTRGIRRPAAGHAASEQSYAARYGPASPVKSQQPRTKAPPGQHSQMPLPPHREQLFSGGMNAGRVLSAGGELLQQILHPSFIPWEEVYRREPEEGMFSSSVSPENPFTFELGAYTVPENQALVVLDTRPDIYRFSGLDAGDFVPVEARRFGSIIGFDFTIDQERQLNARYELDPAPIQRQSLEAFKNRNFSDPQQQQSAFNLARTNSFATAAGAGLSLQPQRPQRPGAPDPVPFSYIAWAEQTIQARGVLFRPLTSPIAFIEFGVSGFLVPTKVLGTILEGIKPPTDARETIR